MRGGNYDRRSAGNDERSDPYRYGGVDRSGRELGSRSRFPGESGSEGSWGQERGRSAGWPDDEQRWMEDGHGQDESYRSSWSSQGQDDYSHGRPGQGYREPAGFESTYRHSDFDQESDRGGYGRADRSGYGQRYGRGNGSTWSGERDGRSSSWAGGARSQGGYFGRGPKDYRRSDDRIREDISDRMSDDDELDASEITLQVKDGEVTLTGTVDSRESKRSAEELAERCSGVTDVINNLRVKREDRSAQSGQSGQAMSTTQASSSRTGKTAGEGR